MLSWHTLKCGQYGPHEVVLTTEMLHLAQYLEHGLSVQMLIVRTFNQHRVLIQFWKPKSCIKALAFSCCGSSRYLGDKI